MSAHTPGPWEVEREVLGDEAKSAGPPAFVKQIGPFEIEWHELLNRNQPERIEADIALVSAAPELLECCKRALTESARVHPDFLKQLRAAIAKATGQS